MITASPLPWSYKIKLGNDCIVDKSGDLVATFESYKDAAFLLALIEGTKTKIQSEITLEGVVEELQESI